jgi:hypothetical protein
MLRLSQEYVRTQTALEGAVWVQLTVYSSGLRIIDSIQAAIPI